MTYQEKIIVSAYTGYLMCDFKDVHKYIEEKLGRPVYTHELASLDVELEIAEKIKPDFLALCGSKNDESYEDIRKVFTAMQSADDYEPLKPCEHYMDLNGSFYCVNAEGRVYIRCDCGGDRAKCEHP